MTAFGNLLLKFSEIWILPGGNYLSFCSADSNLEYDLAQASFWIFIGCRYRYLICMAKNFCRQMWNIA